MELYINDSLVGITPHDSDTVQILLNAVTKELDEDLIIATMVIDGEYKSLDDPAILNTLIHSIQKVELVVATKIEIGVSLIEEGKNFLLLGAKELQNGSLMKKNELINSFAWILESLEALKSSVPFPPTDIPIIKAMLTQIIKRLDDNQITLEQTSSVAAELINLISLFETLQHKLLNMEQFNKESTYAVLREILPKLPDLATNFQTGNDVAAIQELCEIIDAVEMFVRYSATVQNDDEIAQHAINLKDISMQLLHAFENKDFILIADIVEYDLAECLESIVE